ncbi:DNA translocase SftA [Paraliobacillus sp. PM-2]|uniref:DNA translocase FtsK n=1 Tax=Paraliobacillus sp. PM-2 TaxID=1462524 RepID=UPI00061B9730|nr:DNA translocase FtsK [Paraliobacillus sp. PM-2]CQR48166.1 DNA translocase SftA [Paraliobacillus sp. PM-2]
MLDQWKDKIKKWLNSPDEKINSYHVGNDIEQNNYIDQKVETKVVYQYPSNKKFNFPAIPGKPKKHSNQQNERYIDLGTESNDNKKHTVDIEENQKKRKPFTPTPVPSPVYGFRKRPNEENEQGMDTPAYLRKEEIHKNTAEILKKTKEVNNNNDLLTFGRENRKKHNQKTEQNSSNQALEQENQLIGQSAVTKRQNDFADDSKTITPTEGILNSEENTKKAEDQRPRKSTEKGKQAQPFNVRMRPSDKKRYYQRKETNKGSVKRTQHKTPPFHLLNEPVGKQANNNVWIEEQSNLLEKTLKQFHVNAKVVATMQGPAVTRFEVQPEAGVKVSKIKNLSDDIKLNMAAKDIRMEAPIPGKHAIGIEIPNEQAKAVSLQEIFQTNQFQENQSPLNIALGLDIAGSPIVTDIKKMPHGLIAGATGSGKSVCINTILISLIYKASHEDVRLMLIDPKMVELAPYNEIPHLVAPVITDVKAATHALKWAVSQMEERYEKFVQEGTRDIDRYNQKMEQKQRFDDKMAYIVIVIDELADLMMVSPQDVEDAICRIAQKARACGIHLLLATQRPSVDVITGLIKANIPTRIAFSVSSQVDSRTIIDTNGAERLLGKGDMLFVENGARHPVRIQGAFVTDEEIERVTAYAKKLAPANYLFEQEDLLQQVKTEEVEDELYTEALSFVMEQNGASASLLQRRFKIGYNRAARLIDTLEDNGIISAQKGSKPRDILVSANELDKPTK